MKCECVSTNKLNKNSSEFGSFICIQLYICTLYSIHRNDAWFSTQHVVFPMHQPFWLWFHIFFLLPHESWWNINGWKICFAYWIAPTLNIKRNHLINAGVHQMIEIFVVLLIFNIQYTHWSLGLDMHGKMTLLLLVRVKDKNVCTSDFFYQKSNVECLNVNCIANSSNTIFICNLRFSSDEILTTQQFCR